MSTTATPATPVVAGIEVAKVKIPLDRGDAFALYGKAKDATKAAYALVTAARGDDFSKAMNAWLVEYKYPTMLLWNRVAAVHQGNQGLTGSGNDAFAAFVKKATA